jgi:hypothetical protein
VIKSVFSDAGGGASGASFPVTIIAQVGSPQQ